ncbi:DUF3159 domain-containing protein [Nostocoides sp. HKS02]|uniref:DUF3159 domain-containing protein n=1 Tax=Nostocoides sp. HKS02 TaxID=1813880 RepID=UPI0012B44A31|nr:DUF3159 domain-containing protein [Tetrasphaera sp. HKS02]QGN57517.1 DUF3159 domain-containing protein [Tetrasphaera sp. HKS02]
MPTDPASGAGPTVEAVIRHRLSAALGGWRGSLEAALPTLAFVVVWTWRHQAVPALLAAGAITVVLAVVRVAQRQSLQFVLSAALATGVAAFFVLRSGRAEDAFLPSLLKSTAFGAGALLSVVLRWPVMGFMVSAGDPHMAEDPFGWRRDSGMVRVCQRLTMVLVGLYAVRLAVMLPLYLASKVAWLGVASVVLGWPLWLAAVGVMGSILVRGSTPLETATPGQGAVTQGEPGHSSPRGTR